MVSITLLLSMAVTSGPFYISQASAMGENSISGTDLHNGLLSFSPASNGTVTANQHVVFLPTTHNTHHASAFAPSLARQATTQIGKIPGNDGYCFYGGGSCGNLTYHGGTVMHNAKLLAVFWVGGSFSDCSTSHYFENSTNDPGATSPNDCSYINLQVQFLKDLCSDPFMQIAAQYTDGSGGAGPCTFVSSANNPWVDTAPFPHTTILDSDIQTEAQNMLNHVGLSGDANTEVFVFLPYNVPSCIDSDPSHGCFGTAYCAYHTFSGVFAYASMPDAASAAGSCGLVNTSPNSDPSADLETSPLSHELIEAITDPSFTGWYYQNGSHEISDECSYDSLVPTNADGSDVHLGLHGNSYIIQSEWSNANAGCTLSFQSLPAPPSAPSEMSATAQSSSSIKVAWAASSGATNYNVFSSTSPSGPFTTLVGSPTTTTFTDTGLSPNTVYYYKLTATNSGGTSAITNTATQATTNTTSCTIPVSGDWTISSSCTVATSTIVPANVIINSGTVLTIPSGVTLTIPFTTNHILIHHGGGVLIKSGGKLN